MPALVAIVLLAAGLGLVIAGAEAFLDGLLASAARLGVSAFAITVVISGFEPENLAAGIAANAKGLPGAAAGTFLGGTTFLALGVSGLAAVIAPIRATSRPPRSPGPRPPPVPVVALGLDGELSRLDGALLVVWFAIALLGMIWAARGLLEPEQPERRRHPFAWLLGGLAVLTVGGALLAEGIRGSVGRLGVSQTLLGNTVVAASVEAGGSPASPRPAAAAGAILRSATSPARSPTSPPSTPGSSRLSSRLNSTRPPATYTSRSPSPQRSCSAPPSAYGADSAAP